MKIAIESIYERLTPRANQRLSDNSRLKTGEASRVAGLWASRTDMQSRVGFFMIRFLRSLLMARRS